MILILSRIYYYIRAFIIMYISLYSIASFSDDYPKTLNERKYEEMGSILGGDGIVFRPGKIKAKSTSTGSTINKYLWQAAIDVLSDLPLASTDGEGGVIITDWYYPNPNIKTERMKLNVIIKSALIEHDSVQVRLFAQVLKNDKWVNTKITSNLAHELEAQILKRTQHLYIQSKR